MGDRKVQIGSISLCSRRTTALVLQVIAVGFVLASAVTVGILIAGTFHWALGVAIVTCAVGGIASSALSQKVKAEDPNYHSRMRNEASNLSLEQISRKYGLEHMFRAGLLNQSSFAEKYHSHVKGKNVNEIMDYYEKVSQSLYNCPHPAHSYLVPVPRSSKAQWRIDVKNLSFPEILSRFSLDRLEKYGIVDLGELAKLRELEKVYLSCVQKKLDESFGLDAQVSAVVAGLHTDFIYACQTAESSGLPLSEQDRVKNAARGRYEEALRMQSHLKESGQRTIENAYQSAVKDLDLRYRAYVRLKNH